MLAFDKVAVLESNGDRMGTTGPAGSGTNSLGLTLKQSSLVSDLRGNLEASQERNLDKWKEEEQDEDGFGASAGESARVGTAGVGSASSEGVLKRERAKRAVTSESWDDDFLFQHEPAPPASPSHSTSRPPSRISRPTTPLPSKTSKLPPPSLASSSQTRPRNVSPSTSFHRGTTLDNLLNPSLDSLVSSLDWSAQSDLEEPTLTLSSEQSTPKVSSRTSPPTFAHRSNLSTSTARPQETVTYPLDVHLPRRPLTRPISYDSSSRIPSNATTNRSDTPSLTADSLRSLASTFTTGDELRTETEDDETEDERRTIETSPRSGLFNLKRYSRELLPSPPTSPPLKPSQSKRWRFGRTKKEASETETKEVGQRSSGIFGRRTGPRELEEVVTIDRIDPDLLRSGLPLPARDGQFVVLGRRSRTSTETASSSNQSPARITPTSRSTPLDSRTRGTKDSADSQSRPHRTSLQFLPSSSLARSPPPSPFPLSPYLPPTSNNWTKYDASTSTARDDETTEADFSDFSGDERFHLPTRLSNIRRRSIAATAPSTSRSPGSPTFPSDFTRPSSPVESILGDRIGKWNNSQVSFASSTSPVPLHAHQPSTTDSLSAGYETTRPEDPIKNRKRKLVKRRPGSELIETGTQPSLAIEDGSSRRPLLSAVSSRSSASSNPHSNSSTLQLPPTMNHERSPSLPQDSNRQSPQRPPNTRRRSSTTPSKATPLPERGDVVEIDREWLGIVPFPPSPPQTSQDFHSGPTRSSPTLRRPPTSRSVSGKSHPPITMKTQAETKAKRNSGGIGQSISNILARSTSTLPLGSSTGGVGKRTPSPAPSAKSGKSSKSLLTRSTSKKGKKRESSEVVAGTTLPKSPLIPPTKKRPSTVISPTKIIHPKLPLSSPSTPTSTIKLGVHARTSTDATRVKSPSISSPSFFSRARNLSRSTNSNTDSPPSPRITRSSSSKQMPPPPVPTRSHATPRPRPPNSTTKGQLNTSFKMPRSQTTPASQHSRPSLKPLPDRTSANSSKLVKKESPPQTRSAQAGHRPSLSLSSIMRSSSTSVKVGNTPSPPLSVAFGSSAGTSEPFERPRTALGTDYPPTPDDFVGEDDDSERDFVLPRRNSLSDLKIPARITNAQKKIEEDLERVKQFAKGVEDLKALRRQYEQLLLILAGTPTLDSTTPRFSLDISVALSDKGTAQSARKLELEYSKSWEQARTLIDLGDGKPQQAQRTSPATLASRRDRCISMAAESATSSLVVSGSETETEETQLASRTTSTSRPPSVLFSLSTTSGSSRRRSLARMPSASSIETEASVGARQREMLKGILAPTNKGASLPSRGPPSPRPSLAVLSSSDPIIEQPQSSSVSSSSPTKRPPFSLQLPPNSTTSSNSSRRVSRVGVSGIREFLLRLRHRATQELANSVGTLPPPPPPHAQSSSQHLSSNSGAPRRSVSDPTSRPVTPSHSRRPTPSSLLQHVAASSGSESSIHRRSLSSSSEEDWDAELASSATRSSQVEQSNSPASLRRSRTVSTGNPSTTLSGSNKEGGGKDMMILTTENMPKLLDKVKEVQEKCETCVNLLKGLTF